MLRLGEWIERRLAPPARAAEEGSEGTEGLEGGRQITGAKVPLPEENRALQLKKGWNGVGLPADAGTAVQFMDDLQIRGEVSETSLREVSETAETADQMARWDWGLWDAVVKRRYSPEHHEIYGRDFPIKPEEGYFIHANEDIRFQ